MPDGNEIRSLKASLLGAIDTAAALEGMKARVLALDPNSDIAPDDLEELARLTLAHAVSSQALRSLVESLRTRREVG
ncbi:MAG: hypothetical protein JF613_02545 [Acidobacteria bacterium]|jgi:hypothetical protein|nr:hypothetical protein [Acidobacteriota bacterium]